MSVEIGIYEKLGLAWGYLERQEVREELVSVGISWDRIEDVCEFFADIQNAFRNASVADVGEAMLTAGRTGENE